MHYLFDPYKVLTQPDFLSSIVLTVIAAAALVAYRKKDAQGEARKYFAKHDRAKLAVLSGCLFVLTAAVGFNLRHVMSCLKEGFVPKKI